MRVVWRILKVRMLLVCYKTLLSLGSKASPSILGLGQLWGRTMEYIQRAIHGMGWNYRKIKVECDSHVAMSLVKSLNEDNHHLYSIINNCKELVARNWNYSISRVYRKQNMAVDDPVHLRWLLSLGFHVFSSPLTSIGNLLNNDANGVARPRAIPSNFLTLILGLWPARVLFTKKKQLCIFP